MSKADRDADDRRCQELEATPTPAPRELRERVAREMWDQHGNDTPWDDLERGLLERGLKERYRWYADRILALVGGGGLRAEVRALREVCKTLLDYEESMDGAEQGDGKEDLYWKAVALARALLTKGRKV